jgi:hypothetical protein
MSEAVYEELMESGLAVTRCQTRGRGILQNVGAAGANLSGTGPTMGLSP